MAAAMIMIRSAFPTALVLARAVLGTGPRRSAAMVNVRGVLSWSHKLRDANE